MSLRMLIALAIPLSSVITAASAQSQFESSKVTAGVITQGSGLQSSKMSIGIVLSSGPSNFESSKMSPGIVLQGASFDSSKMSPSIVLQGTSFQSSKMSVGIVLNTRTGGGVVQRAPLTHW
jgi:hypothetical protein